MAPTILQTLSLCASLTSAFNMDIHNQIGFMAEQYLTPRAKWMTEQILEPHWEGSIGRAAAWADTVARGPGAEHKYSYTWHWISAQDNPPSTCNVYYNRDCQSTGCVTQQIANQTSILSTCLTSLAHGDYTPNANITCANALKWVVHFIGDTAQPLHTSNGFFGGNAFPVLFNGTRVNMHATWDRLIAYAVLDKPKGFSNKQIDPFFASLVERSRADTLSMPREKWLLAGDTTQSLYWATEWAKDSNALNCDFVYGRYINGSDLLLENDYAQDAWPIIELQIAKAAWRLGGWLNALAGRYLGAEDRSGGLGTEL